MDSSIVGLTVQITDDMVYEFVFHCQHEADFSIIFIHGMLLLCVVSSSIFCRATRESLNIEGGVKLEERLNSFDR